VRKSTKDRGNYTLEALMEDQQKSAPENSPGPEEEELKNEELDKLSGGTGGPGKGR
jgi:hypothetical protein